MWWLTSGMRCFMYMALVYTSLKNQEAIADQTMPYGKCEDCTCYDEKGKVYVNLLPLQESDSDRPSFVKSKNGYEFSYSPCRPFKLKGPCQDDVAVCRSNLWEAESSYEKLGEIGGMALGYDSNSGLPELTYPLKKIGKEWHPKVVLNCDPEVTGKADFGIVDVDKEYKFKLTHQSLCPNADCKEPCGGDPPNDEDDHVLEKVGISVSAVGALLAIVGLLIWRRHKMRNDADDNNAGQRFGDQDANRNYQSVDKFINPIGESRNQKFQNNTQPLPARSSLRGDIEVSTKDDFNNLSTLHSVSLSPSKP